MRIERMKNCGRERVKCDDGGNTLLLFKSYSSYGKKCLEEIEINQYGEENENEKHGISFEYKNVQ